MGETDNRPTDPTASEIGQSSPDNPGTAASSGAGAGPGTAGAGAEPKPKRIRKKPVVAADLVAQQPEIVTVNIPEPAPEPAPKRSHKKKPAAAPDLSQLENNIEYVTAAGFGMVGLATKQPDIWAIRPDELQQISQPAARIVERAGQLETTNKYADYALLLGALALVVLPRLILTKTLAAPKKEMIPANAGPNDSRDRNPDRQTAGSIPDDGQNPLNAFYEVN